METKKSKVFTKKLISLFLAVVMAVTSLFGVAFSAQAYQKGGYNDTNVKSNLIAWVDATDDQTLEALLDYLDDFLANMDWDNANETTGAIDIDSAIPSALKSFIALSVDIGHLPHVKVQAKTKGIASSVGLDVTIEGDVNSIDGIIDTLFSLREAILGSTGIKAKASSIANIAGFDLSVIGNINFDVFGNYYHNTINNGAAGYKASDGSYRTNNSAKFIIKGLLKWLLNDNYNNGTSSSLVRNLLYGSFELLPGKRDTIDIYGMLEGLLGMENWEKDSNGLAKYQLGSGIVYNFLKVLIMKNVPIYGDDITVHEKEESSFIYDSEAYKIANYFLQKISFEITYPERVDFGTENNNYGIKDGDGDVITGYREDSSERRYAQAVKAGKFNTSTGRIDSAYATAQGWDPNLIYSQESGYEGNVLVAQYNGMTTFSVSSTDTVHSIVMRALPLIWKTALRDTIQLLHVNYDGHDEHGTNFDNSYYYWVSDNYGWSRSNVDSNYTQAKVSAYMNAKYQDYGFSSAAAFEEYVAYTLTYKESRAAKNKYYNWRDIDASILFNELRYSPLADKYFDIQTGPCNLYFSQLGAPSIITFFDTLFADSNYSSFTLIGKIDDALVAAMSDIFPTSSNIGMTVYDDQTGEYSVNSLTLPALSTSSSETVSDVVSTLISDAGLVFQYAADSTDANMLNHYYAIHGTNVTITEANIEEAIIPFAISALKHWDITASIHNSDWDKVCDIESGAVVALQEYLAHTYPDRDYSQYWDLATENVVVGGETVATYKHIVAKSGENLLDNVIVPMAGDALLFVVTAAGVPVYKQTPGATTVKTEGYNNSGGAEILDPYNYTFFGKGAGLNNVLWQTINGVACYFAVDKGVAGLANLEGQVTKSKTIWQNLDVVINALLPAITQVFPLSVESSKFSSKKVIWDQLVNGVADVATNQLLTNLLSYVGNILVCTPIKTTKVLNFAIFDVVKPLVNLLLGSRTGTANIITQTTSTTNPVDNFLKRGYLIDTALTNLIGNLYAVLYNTSANYSISSYNALALLLNALHLIPKLQDNRIGGVSAKLQEHAVTSTSVDVKMDIRNESWGFASFYKTSGGTTVQRGRSDAQILNYKVYNPDGTVNNSFTVQGDGDYAAVTSLPAEAYTRVRIQGTAQLNKLYTVEVNYSMTAKNTVSGGVSQTYSAKAVDFLYVGNTINEGWSEAYSGNYISDTAAAGLITEATVGNLKYRTPNYLGAGSNANSCEYTYKVLNTGSSAVNVANTYATVAANTAGFYIYSDSAGDFVPSSAASGTAYVAVDKAGNVLDSSGEVVTDAASFVADENYGAMGYILDADGNYQAVTVETADIGNYRPGTPLRGVYLDTTTVNVPAQKTEGSGDDATTTVGEGNVRIVASTSQSGLDSAVYAPMVVRASTGKTFNTIIATGNIDGAYSDYKSLATGLASHYRTSSDSTAYNAVKTQLTAALASTIANGINASNVAANIDVEDAKEALIELAKANNSVEVQDLTYFVSEARRGRHNTNYTSPALYEKSVDIAKEAEGLVTAIAQQEEVTDQDGNTRKRDKRDADGYVIYDYYSFEPSIKIQEATRIYTDIYEPQAVLKSFNTVKSLITGEVTHATSAANEYDETIAATANSASSFTFSKIANSAHRYEYSTVGEDEYDDVYSYDVYANSADITLKFGAVDTADNNKLINSGYTEASWNAYVDALGECLDAISQQKPQHDLYTARCHLVMAENNLEEGTSEGITISGTVYIARNNTATTGTFGARGINFKVDGDYVLDDNGQPAATSSEQGHYGEFEITVPERTTEITICSDSTVDRTVTLSGTQDISGANIKVVTVNYAKDGAINTTDLASLKRQFGTSTAAYDLNNDGSVNSTDLGSFKALINKPVSYSAQSLD